MQNDAGVNWQLVGNFVVGAISGIKVIDYLVADINLFDASPAAVGNQLGAIFLGFDTDG
jgi:hypothetical protein